MLLVETCCTGKKNNLDTEKAAEGKEPSARSKFLKALMPVLAQSAGNKVVDAFASGDAAAFTEVWAKLGEIVAGKMESEE